MSIKFEGENFEYAALHPLRHSQKESHDPIYFSLLSYVLQEYRLCTRNDREPGSLFPLEAHSPLEKINKY